MKVILKARKKVMLCKFGGTGNGLCMIHIFRKEMFEEEQEIKMRKLLK